MWERKKQEKEEKKQETEEAKSKTNLHQPSAFPPFHRTPQISLFPTRPSLRHQITTTKSSSPFSSSDPGSRLVGSTCLPRLAPLHPPLAFPSPRRSPPLRPAGRPQSEVGGFSISAAGLLLQYRQAVAVSSHAGPQFIDLIG